MHPCWNTLGIAPTPDEREIKRAYAKLLKHIRPEEQPQEFQHLREAFDQALWESEALRNAPLAPVADDRVLAPGEAELEERLRPYIHRLAELNEQGSVDEAMAALDETLADFGLSDPAQRDALTWELLEDGLLFVCCDIQANHDDFLRRAIHLCGWLEEGHWLREKDPKTVEWLGLRLQEADALTLVDALLDSIEQDGEDVALQGLDKVTEDERLVNLDVRLLFEAELMVGLAQLPAMPLLFAKKASETFGWQRDHRHLEDYHPDAWQDFKQKSGQLF